MELEISNSPLANSAKELHKEFYKEVEAEYGHLVKPEGNMQKKEFFELINRDYIEADFIIPIDFNDIRILFDRAQEIDAVSTTCEPAEFAKCLESAIDTLKKHHLQSKIRKLAVAVGIDCDGDPACASIVPFSNAIYALGYDFMWNIIRRKDMEPGQVAITVTAGFNQNANG